MRLLNIRIFVVEEFYDPPKYAILSHTWDRELTLQEWQSSSEQQRKAYRKAACAAEQSVRDGLDYIWIDRLHRQDRQCRAIRSHQFSWYEGAEVCYTYLFDVGFQDLAAIREAPFRKSRWFTRSWTLQELVAPSDLIFYSCEWIKIGTRDQLGV
ncbi:HET-domain-containing protein [Xylaria sp. FL0043]|nr:HET-domain-containing protein [Xylaria sp. FL0043]